MLWRAQLPQHFVNGENLRAGYAIVFIICRITKGEGTGEAGGQLPSQF